VRAWLSAFGSAGGDVSESVSGADLGKGVSCEATWSDVDADDDGRSLETTDPIFDEMSAFEPRFQGTTTRSFTASKAAETHKSKRTVC
jgi:hypothetical protein